MAQRQDCSGLASREDADKHCWHWTGVVVGMNPERFCCFCGRMGLAKPFVRHAGHGPYLARQGDDANGAQWVA